METVKNEFAAGFDDVMFMLVEHPPHHPAVNEDDIDAIIGEYEKKFGEISVAERSKIVMCPECGKTGRIQILDGLVMDLLMETDDHVYEYPVPAGKICEHFFMVKIDAHLSVRT